MAGARHLEQRERQLDRQRALTRLNQLVSSALDVEVLVAATRSGS